MDTCVQLSNPTFQDIQFLNCDAGGTAPITVRFCAIGWKLVESSIYINECTDFLDRKAGVLVPQSTLGNWVLHVRRIYVLYGEQRRAPESSPSPKDSSVKRSTLEDGASRTASKFKWDGETTVTQLPDEYNGNVVFELPPAILAELAKKGGGLTGMDRGNDCWQWTRCVTTSAKVGGKSSLYSVNKIRCVGSLKCVNDQCRYFLNEGQPNKTDWPKKVHCEKPYEVGLPVPLKTHVCGHCGSPPLCDASCEAKMYYVIPKLTLDVGEVVNMTRIAIQELNFEENVLMPNVNAAESVHAAWQKSSLKKQASLLEITMEDNWRALIQIVRYQAFEMGRGGGNGPSLFELQLRAAARLGTTDAFEKAFDFAIRRTAPLANIPHIISGDINTTSRKCKGPATSTIHPTDTHRHDRVAVTTQVNRTVRGRLSFYFEPPQCAEMEPGESSRLPQHAVTEPGESSRPPVSAVTAATTLSSSTDDSAEPVGQNDVTDSQPVQRNQEVPMYTFITSLSSDDEPAEDPFQQKHPHFLEPEPDMAGPEEPEFEVPEEPYFEVPADPEIAVPRPYIADPDEPEVVVLGVTPRRRPNTMASMTR
ncbi:hypothetical protein R1sor_019240 [Riccia sorocarpa]|uniref:Uncharacterized protein n=1 Tax=Riccia sorocarpa TaxID=122646 RepID=A0ABD3IC02_9MARC